jgi:hypothetical protein
VFVAWADSAAGLQNLLSDAKFDWYREKFDRREALLVSHLAFGARGLAIAALIWCILSWRTESGFAVSIAVLFTALAIGVSLLSFL